MAQNQHTIPKVNKAGKTPLCVAAESKHIHLVAYILTHELEADTSKVQENVQRTIKEYKPPVLCIVEFLLTITTTCVGHEHLCCTNIVQGKYKCCCCEELTAIADYFLDSLTPSSFSQFLGINGYITSIKRCLVINRQFNVSRCFLNAASRGHLLILELLLQTFPNETLPGKGALLSATKGCYVDVIVFLVDNIVDSDDFSRYSPELLSIAALKGNLEIVQYYMKKGVPNNYIDSNGKGNLLMAACSGNTDVMQFLIDHGSSIDEVDNEKKTSLHCAILRGLVNVILFLHEKDDPSFQQRYGKSLEYTCLMGASSGGRIGVVECLIELGCDPTEEIDGKTCLLVAAKHKYSEIMSFLISLDVWSERQLCSQGDALLNMIAKTPFYPFGSGTWDVVDRLVNNGWLTVEAVKEKVEDEFYEKLMQRMREKRTHKRAVP